MTPERWQEVQAAFDAALELAPDALERFLTKLSAEDPALKEEVQDLLSGHAKTKENWADGNVLDLLQNRKDQEVPAGTRIGEYVVENEIGSGAFGRVYRVVHPIIKKRAAAKLLDPLFSRDPRYLSRFITEARAANEIGHPNIIDIFGFGQLEDGRHYYLMEYIDALPLDVYLQERGRLSLSEALLILAPIASALDAAHAHHIVHRDIKPSNILVDNTDETRPVVKLLDFGIAKLLGDKNSAEHLTQTGNVLGTPTHMAPEQVHGTALDHRTDIYAFGVLCYQLLTGSLPFRGANPVATMMKHVHETPKAPSSLTPSVAEATDQTILAMLAKPPDARPQSLRAVIQALRQSSATANQAKDRPLQRRVIGGAVLLILTLLGGLSLFFGTKNRDDLATRLQDKKRPSSGTFSTEVHQKAWLELRVLGKPKGAQIFDDSGNLLGQVPSTIRLKKDQKEINLVVRAKGFRPQDARVQLRANKIIEVNLTPLPKLHEDLENAFAP